MAGRKTRITPRPIRLEEIISSSKKELLVGTIFAKDDSLQRKWLDLQLKFLKDTTFDFDHVCVLYGESESEYFSSRTEVINIRPFAPDTNSKAHVVGLNFLSEIFRSRRQMYRNFLFLDSDAFPIRSDWQTILENKMKKYSVALALRTEDLETRLHASILFAKPDSLDELYFKITTSGVDLLGDSETDIVAGDFQESQKYRSFPLIRSNQVNVHPTLCGIYYDCFYHHCCGSGRAYNLRSRDYWDIFCDKDINVNSYTDELMTNPINFVSKLAGWSPERYLKI
jgi:hypothetical protein